MYSTAGQSVTTLTTAGSITNPMAFESEPLIRITGNGNITLSVNSNSYVLTGVVGYIDIDSQMLNAFKGLELQNNKNARV